MVRVGFDFSQRNGQRVLTGLERVGQAGLNQNQQFIVPGNRCLLDPVNRIGQRLERPGIGRVHGEGRDATGKKWQNRQ